MRPEVQSRELVGRFAAQELVPLIEIEDRLQAVDLARLLVDEGLPAVEVVLRTPDALAALELMAAVDGCLVGSGSITSSDMLARSIDAGAGFVVTPGIGPKLMEHVESSPIPVLPGAMTASEVVRLQEIGYSFMKLFPASQSGGPGYLRALGGPLPGIRFCPTGGVSIRNLCQYLELENVVCVGGSWLASRDAIANRDWDGISASIRLAKATLAEHRSRLDG